jgi:acetyl esterase/lipase
MADNPQDQPNVGEHDSSASYQELTAFRRRDIFALSAAVAGAALARPALAADTATLPATGDGAVHLPARSVAPPTSISEQAQAYLRKTANRPEESWPPASDKDGWRRQIAEHDAHVMGVPAGDITLPGMVVESLTMGGVIVFVARSGQTSPGQDRPHMFIHGGGWTGGGGKMARVMAQIYAGFYGGTVYAVDYRTPPDHPFPAPLDDCLAVYRELVRQYTAGKILVSGGSAGGNLAAALMLKAHDSGLPRPAALVLETPTVDLTCSGDTLQTNQYLDTLLKVWRKDRNVAVYASGADLNNPYLSPLKGDLSKGFPPTYLRSGTRDLFLSDTVRLHAALRKAGVAADLYVGEAMPHGGFGMQTPEDADARSDTGRWLKKYWA